MPRYIHDSILVSYEVLCEARIIKLRTEFRFAGDTTHNNEIIFRDVQGYHFENDAFGNIISDVETVTVDRLLAEYGNEISESYRMAGALGSWASNLQTASVFLQERGMQGFLISSSYGLSGWILAREMSIQQS